MKKYFIIGGCVLVMVACVLVYVRILSPNGDSKKFLSAYDAYSPLFDAHEKSARTVGDGLNATRQKLNTILTRILMEPMPDKVRSQLAGDGLAAAVIMDAQIADIKSAEAAMAPELEKLRRYSRGGAKADEMMGLLDGRIAVIHDIETISYEMNSQLKVIFNRIITDQGVLTAEHVTTINDETSLAEQRFEKLLQYYRDIDTMDKNIDATYAELAH